MNHFVLMRQRINTTSFLQELAAYNKPWSEERARAISVHKDTLSIHLRVPILQSGEQPKDAQTDRKTPDYILFPKLTKFLEEFAQEINGSLARINIVGLKPDSKVYRHFDDGTYYQKRDRYHLVLQSPAGSKMLSGDEECIFQEGELWWFDNKAMHEAFNPSDGAERIHVIFDVLPNAPWWKRILKR